MSLERNASPVLILSGRPFSSGVRSRKTEGLCRWTISEELMHVEKQVILLNGGAGTLEKNSIVVQILFLSHHASAFSSLGSQ